MTHPDGLCYNKLMARFSLLPFDQILDGIQETRAWYEESLGIPTAGTRLELIHAKTAELIRDLNSSLIREDIVERWSNFDTYYAISDGAGFGKICREIRQIGPNLLPKKTLRAILHGPLSPTDENPSDGSVNARNLFAELELAADLSEKGIKPSGFDDLQFDFDGVPFAVQCKRLMSPRSVANNIQRAYEQLQRNLVTDHHRGLIALTAERVLNLDGRILRVEKEEDLLSEVHRLIEEFRTRFGHPWWNFVDTRVVGLIIVLRFLCYTVRHNVIGPAYYVSFINLASPECLQASELKRLQALTSYLQRAATAGTIPL